MSWYLAKPDFTTSCEKKQFKEDVSTSGRFGSCKNMSWVNFLVHRSQNFLTRWEIHDQRKFNKWKNSHNVKCRWRWRVFFRVVRHRSKAINFSSRTTPTHPLINFREFSVPWQFFISANKRAVFHQAYWHSERNLWAFGMHETFLNLPYKFACILQRASISGKSAPAVWSLITSIRKVRNKLRDIYVQP